MATAFPTADHDHSQCRRHALDQAEAQCAAQGIRLTDARRRVLAVLWEDHCPISAYEILDRLNADLRARDAQARLLAPPAVYRALEFLMAHGMAHKLNSLNAYIGCAHPGRQHGAQFFICRSCRTVAEVRSEAISGEISSAAQSLGFQAQAPLVEVEGLCARCQQNTGEVV
jgi:Fur family zinc uptake transcriptional regulator